MSSKVEGMRWVLARRAASALAILSLSLLITLRFQVYMSRTQDDERSKMAAVVGADHNSPRSSSGDGGGAGGDGGGPENAGGGGTNQGDKKSSSSSCSPQGLLVSAGSLS